MIKIDMFQVQLGAAVLLQFESDDGDAITVLADAGVHGGHFPDDYIQKKLRVAMGKSASEPLHINLLVGTHYDKDHLNRMKAIIEDPNITIDEAWMPPVADDTETPLPDRPIFDHNLLALKFAEDFDSQEYFTQYRQKKRQDIVAIHKATTHLKTKAQNFDAFMASSQGDEDIEPEDISGFVNFAHADMSDDDFFKAELESTSAILGLDHDHGHAEDFDMEDQEYESALITVGDRVLDWEAESYLIEETQLLYSTDRSRYASIWSKVARDSNFGEQRLAWLRKSAASRAVNAKAMNEVIVALKRRNVPIFSRSIEDGQPRRFVWSKTDKKLMGAKNGPANGFEFSLLGPSKSLIKKHWHRLPIQQQISYALFTKIPIVGVTPSNQLSYVLHFKSKGQGILISGDTGCNDFKPKKRNAPYYPALLQALEPLNIIQVSHHGGANAHFYRVLQEAAGKDDLANSHMLLSHETNSKSRPSNAFRLFVENIRTSEQGPNLLFTSKPKKEKVEGYAELISAAVGATSDEGDVSLTYSGNSWRVTRHAIEGPSLITPPGNA